MNFEVFRIFDKPYLKEWIFDECHSKTFFLKTFQSFLHRCELLWWGSYFICVLLNVHEFLMLKHLLHVPKFREFIAQCERTGCIRDKCFPHCKFSSDGLSRWSLVHVRTFLLPLETMDWQTDYCYYCMVDREHGHAHVKCRGKWSFKRLHGIQVWFTSKFLVGH